MITFWNSTLQLLKNRNQTQADLARELNVSRSIIHNWIKYDRYPQADKALKIACFLSTSIESLIQGHESILDKPSRTNLNFDLSPEFVEKIKILTSDELLKLTGYADSLIQNRISKK